MFGNLYKMVTVPFGLVQQKGRVKTCKNQGISRKWRLWRHSSLSSFALVSLPSNPLWTGSDDVMNWSFKTRVWDITGTRWCPVNILLAKLV